MDAQYEENFKKKTLILFTLLFGKTKPEREGEEVRERGSERERRGRERICHLLVHSPIAYKVKHQELHPRSCKWVVGAVTCRPPGCALAGGWVGSGGAELKTAL